MFWGNDTAISFPNLGITLNNVPRGFTGGNLEFIEYLKRLSISCGCFNSIEWLGYQKDVLSYMNKATALIVASHFEGFGRMTAEACFAGCLVIGRNSGGTREILKETSGFLFNDNNELVSSMQMVSSLAPKEYQERALYAQHKAQELYSIDNNIDQTYNFYKEILSQWKKKRES